MCDKYVIYMFTILCCKNVINISLFLKETNNNQNHLSINCCYILYFLGSIKIREILFGKEKVTFEYIAHLFIYNIPQEKTGMRLNFYQNFSNVFKFWNFWKYTWSFASIHATSYSRILDPFAATFVAP